MVAHGDAMLRQHHGVELDVEADLQNACRFQQRPQRLQRVAGLDLVRREAGGEQAGAVAGLLVGERDVAGVVGRQRQRDAADLRLHRIDRVGLGVDREMAGIVGARDPGLEFDRALRMVWYLLRSTGSFRAASARAAASEIGVPLRLAALSCLSAPGLRGAPLGRCEEIAGGAARAGSGAADGRRGFRGAALVARIRFHIRRIDLRIFGDAAGQGGEFHRLQERDQLARIGLVHREFVERHVELDLVVEQHQLPRDPRLLGVLDQRLAPLRLLDLAGARQQRFQIAIFDDQLRRGLDADAGHARHVVGGIAGQRLHLDHLLRRHAEFLDHLGNADAAVLHGVVHRDACR